MMIKFIFNQNYTIYNVEYQHSLSAILKEQRGDLYG